MSTCPRCGALNEIVNQCGCDPDNLPTKHAPFTSDDAPLSEYHYCRGGAGFILYCGRQTIWETVNMSDMLKYMRENGIKDVEYRPLTIARFGPMPSN